MLSWSLLKESAMINSIESCHWIEEGQQWVIVVRIRFETGLFWTGDAWWLTVSRHCWLIWQAVSDLTCKRRPRRHCGECNSTEHWSRHWASWCGCGGGRPQACRQRDSFWGHPRRWISFYTTVILMSTFNVDAFLWCIMVYLSEASNVLLCGKNFQ